MALSRRSVSFISDTFIQWAAFQKFDDGLVKAAAQQDDLLHGTDWFAASQKFAGHIIFDNSADDMIVHNIHQSQSTPLPDSIQEKTVSAAADDLALALTSPKPMKSISMK